MSGFDFARTPQEVPKINTKYRKIVTKLPVPESLKVFEDLDKYESRSMHGQMPIVWDRAENFQVFDKYGNAWIDFTSTIFVTNSGHANPLVVSALREAVEKKLYHTYTYANESRAKFLKKLIEMTPDFCEKAFLMSSGTEASECAVKLMRMHGQAVNPKKTAVISFTGSMHGRTMGAELLRGDPKFSAWINHTDPNMHQLPFPYEWTSTGKGHDWAAQFQKDMENLAKKGLDYGNICGFMIESYQGWGAIFYPKEYVQALAKFAKEHNAVLTFDEIQAGFGRTGKLFCYMHYDVEPDLICTGKGMSGSLPLSAVIGRRRILDLPDIGSMSSTHSGNPLCCAAGLANITAIEKENLVAESKRKGAILHERLNRIKEKYSHRISYIFGKGLVAALLFKDPVTGKPEGLFPSLVSERCMQKGLLVVHTGRESIKLGPPLTISDDALAEGIGVLEESIGEIENERKKK